jgi:hypothetical protein
VVLASFSILAIAAAGPAAASADNITVNDNNSGSGPPGATCATPDESSIQTAVTGATAGDNILVCAGQYPGSVVVDRELGLRGAQAGNDARDRSGASQESVILGDGATNGGVSLAANGIVLDGFVVTNAADPSIGAGVAMSSANNGQAVGNNVITDNTIGISANNADGADSVIFQNKLSDNNLPGSASGNAIYADANVDDLSIDNNSFSNQKNAGILLTETDSVNDSVSITDNSFEGSNGNPARNELRVLLLHTGNSEVSGNTFTDMNNNAVQLADGNSNVTVQNNTITGSGFAGVRITDFGETGENSGISVLGNTLTGGDTGINVAPQALSGSLTATGNRIARNATAGILFNDTDATAAADDNWWGCNAGPGQTGCDTIGGTDAGDVDASEVLTLSLSAPAKIKAKKRKTLTAEINGGTPCLFPDGTEITFATTRGQLGDTTPATADCEASTRLRAARKGRATVSATLDNETQTAVVRFKKRK